MVRAWLSKSIHVNADLLVLVEQGRALAQSLPAKKMNITFDMTTYRNTSPDNDRSHLPSTNPLVQTLWLMAGMLDHEDIRFRTWYYLDYDNPDHSLLVQPGYIADRLYYEHHEVPIVVPVAKREPFVSGGDDVTCNRKQDGAEVNAEESGL